jgi:hypothetical protein
LKHSDSGSRQTRNKEIKKPHRFGGAKHSVVGLSQETAGPARFCQFDD